MIGRQQSASRRPVRSGSHGSKVVVGLFCALLAACAYRGDVDNPATTKATWVSYLNGDDIRSACGEGGALHYRLIYNADYDKQLRSYDLIGDGADGAVLTARVQGPSGLLVNNKLDLRDPLKGYRWQKSQAVLDGAALERLNQALQSSGAFEPAPAGLQLFSKETYWVSSLCRDGVFYFHAWRFPSDPFEEITFDAVLFDHDRTEVAVRPPQAIPPGQRFNVDSPRRRQTSDERGSTFNLKVGETGLEGYLAL